MDTGKVAEAIDIVQRYMRVIENEMDIDAVYIYGSYAKGLSNEDSDIDVAVVSNSFSDDTYENTVRLMQLRRKIDFRIEPHPFRLDDFDLCNPYVKEIVDTGIKINLPKA